MRADPGELWCFRPPVFQDIRQADSHHLLLALAGGVIFNVANLLLVAAIDIAGLAVAFPVGIGLALVVGAVSSYVLAPSGNPLLLFGGVALVTVAIVLDALAYRLREAQRHFVSARGVVISLVAGLLMGSFYPFVSKSMTGQHALGPYAIALIFTLGVAACAITANYLLMIKPLAGGESVSMRGYWRARGAWHLWGILGGIIWSTGAVFNFVALRANVVGPAVSYSIGQGATMISAAWASSFGASLPMPQHAQRPCWAWMFVFFSPRPGRGRAGSAVLAQ